MKNFTIRTLIESTGGCFNVCSNNSNNQCSILNTDSVNSDNHNTSMPDICGTEKGASALNIEFTEVVTDSRAVTPGCLFAAICGERVDGHDFMQKAVDSGALCVLCERIPEGFTGNAVVVPNTVTALGDAATFYRGQFDIPIIGVTGSVGKTTAKELIASVLSQRYSVHKTPGNFNNELGVPLTLFGLRENHTAAVVELGISHFGEMSRIGAMASPTSALYTVIGDAHLEFLGSREGVMRAKGELLSHLQPPATVFYNGEDPILSIQHYPARAVSYGREPNCNVFADNIFCTPEGETSCTIHFEQRSITVKIPAYGEHMVMAALEGAAVGISLGLTDSEIAAGIAAYEPVGHRARVISRNAITIVDDCYNANPTSTASAIRSLMSSFTGRKICVLGDMNELGENSSTLHRKIGEYAAAQGAYAVLTCGEKAADIALGAGKCGKHFPGKPELIKALKSMLLPGDAVLVKASRGMQFEDVVQKI